MDREGAWDTFIEGFTGTAYARRVGTRFRAGPLDAVRLFDEDQPGEPFEEFFARACAPAEAIAAVTAARTLAEHYITALDDRPGLVAAYADGGYRLIHSEALMLCDLAASEPEEPGHEARLVRDAAEAERLNASDSQGITWILPENLADDRMRHYVVSVDGKLAARGRNLRLDAARGYVSRVYTAEAYRRRGLARALMRRLLADEQERGARWSVLTASGMGQGLYAELGYRALATIHIFVPAQ
jgi:ribosomal protein S18 acetylase RimI-like enzyme